MYLIILLPRQEFDFELLATSFNSIIVTISTDSARNLTSNYQDDDHGSRSYRVEELGREKTRGHVCSPSFDASPLTREVQMFLAVLHHAYYHSFMTQIRCRLRCPRRLRPGPHPRRYTGARVKAQRN